MISVSHRRGEGKLTGSLVHPAVAAALALGVLPSEDDATEEYLEELDQLLVAVERPVTDEEALALAGLFVRIRPGQGMGGSRG